MTTTHQLKKVTIVTIFAAIIFSFFSTVVLATEHAEDAVSIEGNVIANTNIYNPTIATDNGVLVVGFDLFNQHTKPVNDLRYGIDIVKKTETGMVVIDSFVPSDVVVLQPGEQIHKEVRYLIPRYFDGTFDVMVSAKNSSGIILSFNSPGSFTFSSNGDYLELVAESCYFTIDNKTEKFFLQQGVDVASTETLNLTCTVVSHGSKSIEVVPSFTSYFRSSYGDKVPAVDLAQSEIYLAAGESKVITLAVPKALEPQAYDLKMFFQEIETGLQISNNVYAHYVLQGSSATIQSVLTNAASYDDGDALSVAITWAPAADTFEGSRSGEGTQIGIVNFDISIKNEVGEDCIAPIKKTAKVDELSFEVNAVTETDCKQFHTTVSITDEAGRLLDTRTIENGVSPKMSHVLDSNSKTFRVIPILIFILSFMLGAGWLIFKAIKSRRSDDDTPRMPPTSGILNSLVFLLLATGFFIGGTQTAEAVTWSAGQYIFTANPTASVYGPGDPVYVNGYAVQNVCSNVSNNYSIVGKLGSTTDTMKGSVSFLFPMKNDWMTLGAPYTPGIHTIYLTGCVLAQCSNATTDITVKGPTVNGSCGATNNSCVAGKLKDIYDSSTHYLWSCDGQNGGNTASCSAPKPQPTNGSCGVAHNKSLFTAPMNDLCYSGNPTSVTGSGPWSWSCVGLAGGLNDSCVATKKVDASCGSANNGSFTSAPVTNLCAPGAVAWLDSSAADGTYNWSCVGQNGGVNNTCSASKKSIVSGVCGSTNNSCVDGGWVDVADSATAYNWSCVGQNGGTNASCSVAVPPIPTNGSCGTTNNVCSAGGWVDVADSATAYNWSCVGQNGGTNASCSVAVPPPIINGSCGTSDGNSFTAKPLTNLCAVGGVGWSDEMGADGKYNWSCTGSGGGSTDNCEAIALTPPPSNCTGTVISSCLLGGANHGVVSAGSCTAGTSGSCSYRCINASWSLVTNNCSIPSADPDLIAVSPSVSFASPNDVYGTWTVTTLMAIKYNGSSNLPVGSDISFVGEVTIDPLYGSLPKITSDVGSFNDPLSPNSQSNNLTRVVSSVPFGKHTVCSRINLDDATSYPEITNTNNTECTTTTLPVPEPPISITANNKLIRAGETTTITWTAHTSYPLACEVSGPGGITDNFDASERHANEYKESITTDPLQNTSEFIIRCTETTITGKVFNKKVIVEVVPNYEEI